MLFLGFHVDLPLGWIKNNWGLFGRNVELHMNFLTLMHNNLP